MSAFFDWLTFAVMTIAVCGGAGVLGEVLSPGIPAYLVGAVVGVIYGYFIAGPWAYRLLVKHHL